GGRAAGARDRDGGLTRDASAGGGVLRQLRGRLEHVERLGAPAGAAQRVGPRAARLDGLAPVAALAEELDGLAERGVGRVDVALESVSEREPEVRAAKRRLAGQLERLVAPPDRLPSVPEQRRTLRFLRTHRREGARA